MDNEIGVARQLFAQCVFNHKINEKACERLEKLAGKIKIINIMDLVLVLIFLVLQIYFPLSNIFGAVSIGLTIFEVAFLFIQKEFPFEDNARDYKKIALRFLKLRDECLALISDLMSTNTKGKLLERRDYLLNQYHTVCDLAPQTDHSDYANAQISLLGEAKDNEEYTWSDMEIDRFLPENLRKVK